MDPTGQYRLYQSPPQLPSPSQLQLPSPSFPRNTLPPIGQRYPPPSFPPHPSLAGSPPAGLPPLSPPSAGWHHHAAAQASHHHQSASRGASGGSYARERERDPLPPPPPRPRRDSSSSVKREAVHVAPAPPHDPRQEHPSAQPEDGMASTSDFVKKLFKMLDDQSIAGVVSWGPAGDCFVVKDMNEFTKSILPRMFKHSNFASFVRQLNKYDFHKVKNNDDGSFGEHSWTFRHPDFHADRPECLENIKRKVPTQRKSGAGGGGGGGAPKSASPAPGGMGLGGVGGGDDAARAIAALEAQVERLSAEQEHTALRLREMRDRYEGTIAELVEWQRSMAQTDGIMRNLIQYFLQLENGKMKDALAMAQATSGSSSAGAAAAAAAAAASAAAAPPAMPGLAAFAADGNPFLPTQEAQRLMGGAHAYPESAVARASLLQMNEISRRAESSGMSFEPPAGSPSAGGQQQQQRPMTTAEAMARLQELQRMREAATEPSLGRGAAGDEPFLLPQGGAGGSGSGGDPSDGGAASSSAQGGGALAPHAGLQVYTVGHLLPRSSTDDENGNWSFNANALGLGLPAGGGGDGMGGMFLEGSSSGGGYGGGAFAGDGGEQQQQQQQQQQQEAPVPAPSAGPGGARATAGSELLRPPSTLRVRRSTFVPGWAVPPRVLVVDDDIVNRKVSSKFLQVAGCTIDIAVDGAAAVDKMNLEQYDLVLMDIVMPKLDGVSATSLIRQFDHRTPIISMTSASKPSDIMNYYSHGMNDILPKPFSKEGLIEMLEKHLMHLKVVKHMSSIPRALTPPLDGSVLIPASAAGALLPVPQLVDGDAGKINPLAGMGLSDEQYAQILQNMLAAEPFAGVPMGDPAALGLGGLEKRALEDGSDGREPKRSRFEEVA